MRYFILTQDARLTGPPIPPELAKMVGQQITRKTQDKEPHKIMAFPIDDNRDSEYPAVLDRSVFILVNTVVKELFEKYDRNITFKAVMFNDLKHGQQHLYWLMKPQTVDCLAAESEFYPNRTLKKLVLDEKMLGDNPVFKIGGILAERLVVRLDAAESLLRRDAVYGIALNPVLTNYTEE